MKIGEFDHLHCPGPCVRSARRSKARSISGAERDVADGPDRQHRTHRQHGRATSEQACPPQTRTVPIGETRGMVPTARRLARVARYLGPAGHGQRGPEQDHAGSRLHQAPRAEGPDHEGLDGGKCDRSRQPGGGQAKQGCGRSQAAHRPLIQRALHHEDGDDIEADAEQRHRNSEGVGERRGADEVATRPGQAEAGLPGDVFDQQVDRRAKADDGGEQRDRAGTRNRDVAVHIGAIMPLRELFPAVPIGPASRDLGQAFGFFGFFGLGGRFGVLSPTWHLLGGSVARVPCPGTQPSHH